MSHYLEHALKILLLPGLLLGLRALARFVPVPRPPAWRRLSRAFGAISARRALSAALLCLPLLLSAALFLSMHGLPVPAVHDEFSYLLAADTFASGRLTNPTHPMWVHFESFHILHVPTYMSMYPPLQGIVLAAGILLGHPWLGVLLSGLAAILLIWWAARQWLPPRWALLAGFMGALLFVGTYWSQSYWGGSTNAAAGALAFGAAGMLRFRLTALGLALFAAGSLFCAASRPYEGGVLCLFLSCWLVFTHTRSRASRNGLGLFAITPAALVLLAGTAAMLAHNRAVTGNPLRLPYQAAFEQYSLAGRFLFEQVREKPVYRHESMQRGYQKFSRTSRRRITRVYSNYTSLQEYYLGIPLFTLFILALPSVRSARVRTPVLAACAGAGALAVVPIVFSHYYAPFAAPFIVACAHVARTLPRLFSFPRRQAWLAGAAVLALVLIQYGYRLHSAARGPNPSDAWAKQRARTERELLSLPGRDLIIVHYTPDHNVNREWVYNRADIDSSEVVWARAMDDENDARLRRYFASRRIWALDADVTPPRLTELKPPAAE